MTKLFEMILQNSFVGILLIVVILLIRQFTKKLSKINVNVLWALLLVELLITPFVTSPFHTMRNVTINTLIEETYDESDTLEQKEESGLIDENYKNNIETDTEDVIEEQMKEVISYNEIISDNMESDNETVNEDQDSKNEEEEFWSNKLIVGTTFEPDSDLKDRILHALNYINIWMNSPSVTDDNVGTPQEKEIYNAVNLIGETKNFLLYGTTYTESMIIRTSDNRYVFAEVPFTSNYHTQPILNEMDYDQDGENELAIIIYVMHGTGVSIKTLFMIDKAADGNWNMYQLLENEYLPQIDSQFDTVYVEDTIRVLFDGKYIGRTQNTEDEVRNKSSNFKYYAGMQIDIHYVEDRIVLNAKLGGYADGFYAGDYFMGHQISMDIIYLGEGTWGFKDFRYSNFNIDSTIENALTLYFTGKIQEVNKYYMVDGYLLKGINKTSKVVSILDISYPVDNLDSGEVEAYVTVRLDGSDSLYYVTIPMKLVDSLMDSWRITDLIFEK